MNKIIVIAPSKEFADTVRNAVGDSFKIYVPENDRDFSFKETLPIAQCEEEQGAEVIITRGGQATHLKEKVNIPVVEVKMTVLDILRTVHSLKTRYQRIGLIGVENIICDYRELGSYIDIKIYPVFSYEHDLDIQVRQAITDQVDFIVGDGMSVDYAKQFGLPGIKLMPSKASVQEAFDIAENLVLARFQERKINEQLRMILETAQDGIFIVSNDTQIVLANNRALHLLQQEHDTFINQPIENALGKGSELVQLIKGEQEFNGEIAKLHDLIVSVSKRTISVGQEKIGWVVTLQDVTQIQKLERKIRRQLNHTGFLAKQSLSDMVAIAPNMKNVVEKIIHFSQTDSTILLQGETGTGKELVAQSIHNQSLRKNRPFVPINCGALPSHLLESELFGYEPGAFTGANRNGKAGLFELAHTGTIFLDEIGEIPLELQSRLLRVIQEREIMRIGGSSIITVDVRIIAATHRNLQTAIEEGKFRDDLYYRLNVLNIPLPSLRDRKEDIPLLVDALLDKMSHRYKCPRPQLPKEMLDTFIRYSWPGNIREMENILERLVVLFQAKIPNEVIFKEVIEELKESHGLSKDDQDEHTAPSPFLEGTLKDMETAIILDHLERNNGNKDLTAQKLGISRATLWRKLKEI
ncbi:PAS domain S-box-containing protein [Pullulanibacillus pueri]|uniref:Sigma-54-dependent Fis family transcriptional regulator n=1 Tax=Pullulanibacillus pueri TaxID=1437324 RepID=A0A8J3EME5_9BACL|nr:sigma 54-interacting transcriptional regulator [Pullulanibacillus pueri]MBM7682811.1 PAS domain S-box-containing protein [Pullulanibacillus pueri]GGH83278.1 sigma-54-dependent Fis family transcriptional regulator [Pullulanibacillus pueri]